MHLKSTDLLSKFLQAIRKGRVAYCSAFMQVVKLGNNMQQRREEFEAKSE